MLRVLIAAATFLAMCAVTLVSVGAGAPQVGSGAAAAAPTVQVYSNPS